MSLAKRNLDLPQERASRAPGGEALTCPSLASLFADLLTRDQVPTLTLTQPWASLMALGAKQVETRSWWIGYRGVVALHTAKGFPGWAQELCEQEPFCELLTKDGYHREPGHTNTAWGLPLGQVIAIGWLEEIQRIGTPFRVTSGERALGNYAVGRYAWRFSRMHRLRTPVAARGSLGLWNWQPPKGFWEEIATQYEVERKGSTR